MGKNKDWIEELKEVVPYILITDRVIGAKEFDTLVAFIEEEKRKSRREVLEEVTEEFGGDDKVVADPEGNILQILRSDLDVWLEEELDKLSTKE